MEVPQNGWLIIYNRKSENPIKTDDFLGYPYFRTLPYTFETRIPKGWRKPNRFRILVVFASISGTISMSL